MDDNNCVPLRILQSNEVNCSRLQLAIEIYQDTGDKQALCLEFKKTVKQAGGISQVAYKAGISRGHLSHILSGRCSPMVGTIMAVLKVLGYRVQMYLSDNNST